MRLLFSFYGAAPFRLAHGRFQRIQLLAGLQQHGALHFELLAGDQVELGQAGLQRALEGGLQFLARFEQARGHQVAEATGEVIELIQVDHGEGAVG